MPKTWGSIGAWAAEAERAEAEEREAAAATAASGATAPAESQSFPSLKEAVSAKPKKKKMPSSEFTKGAYASSGAPKYSSNRFTSDEMLHLPTAPREHSAEEMQHGRLGGGFSSYGRPARTMGMGDRNDSWEGGNRRPYGGFDEDQPRRRGPPPRVSDLEQPSRADEVDNWAMAKKPFQPLHSQDSGHQNRYGGLGSGGGFSRADEVDNWAAGKKPIMPTRSSAFGSGFSREPGPEPDRWTRGGGNPHERSRLNLDPPKLEANDAVVVKTNKPNPFGAARPREEVLAEKGLDWKKIDLEMEAKKATSRPTSSHSSRPSSAQSSRSESQGLQVLENVVKPSRPKVNPFGDAKPREVLLEERGQDWRKIDLQLERRRVDRPETEEEKMLKEEIDRLKKEELERNRDSLQESGGEQSSMHDVIISKEQELEMLIWALDSKVWFGPKAEKAERPVSGSDRAAGFPERPLSQSGSFDESRGIESMDRPLSRGMGDTRPRPGDDRRAFHGGRERGFMGSRDLDRQSSRERW